MKKNKQTEAKGFTVEEIEEEYWNEIRELIPKIAKAYKLRQDLVAAVCDDEEVNIRESLKEKIMDTWETECQTIASKLENKYNCWIEHEEYMLNITLLEEKGVKKT